MNMRDLSKDDDFLSHLLVEKLGTGTVPLMVHKMDSSRRLPKTDTQDLMKIVRRLVSNKLPLQQVVRQAVDELLTLPSIRYYLKSYTQKQINAFATHASRYFELYHPSGTIEIAHTSRYSHKTGKSELCIMATRNLAPGTVVTELKGSMANLSNEEDKELKRTDLRNSDIRRDFSVIHSKSMKKNHLFLGPARFVNHDCDNNCELFREGRYITFRVLRPIAIGEEITAHYGDGYFGKKNKHCLCETCEKRGRGGYSPDHQNEDNESSSDSSSGSDSDSDSDSDSSTSDSDSSVQHKPVLNVNERRTRRGVYAVTKPDDSDDSEDEEGDEEDKIPLADAKDIPADGEIELTAEIDTGSELTSLAPSMASSDGASPGKRSTPGLMTPVRGLGLSSRCSSSLTELTPSTDRSGTPKSNQSTPFRSIISTRRQRAMALDAVNSRNSASGSKDTSPPSRSIEPSPRRVTRSVSTLMSSDKKGKGKSTPTTTSTPASGRTYKGSSKSEPKIKREEPDSRSLRTRPSIAEIPKVSLKPPVPSPAKHGLPTCSTCSNILPVITVDSKVVWGLGASSNSLGKMKKQECPRCIRHFAIYQFPWPSRVPPRGTISVTPRDESPPESLPKKVTAKALQVLVRKLTAAASASASKNKSKKHRREQEEDEDAEEQERPVKRRKSEPEPVRHKPKVTKTYSSFLKKSRRKASPEIVEKRGRGRPRLPSPKRVSQSKIDTQKRLPETGKSISAQPRAGNGRFGRKDKSARKSGESTSSSHENGRSVSCEDSASGNGNDQRETRTSPRRKRASDDVEALEESPRKRAAVVEEQVEEPTAVLKVLPRPVSGFRGGRLVSNPNPLQFALHAWSGPVVLDDSSSEDEKHPETPEDDQSPAVDVAELEEEDPIPSLSLGRSSLTLKPTPFSFAKSRWNGPSASLGHVVKKKPPPLDISGVDNHSLDQDIVLSPLSDDGYVSPFSDDSAFPRKLRHTYPILQPPSASNSYIPESTAFPFLSSGTTPTFINAGWDDTSDASEA